MTHLGFCLDKTLLIFFYHGVWLGSGVPKKNRKHVIPYDCRATFMLKKGVLGLMDNIIGPIAMAYLAWIALIASTSLSTLCYCSVSILCPPHFPKLTAKTILNVVYFSSHQNYPEMHRLDT